MTILLSLVRRWLLTSLYREAAEMWLKQLDLSRIQSSQSNEEKGLNRSAGCQAKLKSEIKYRRATGLQGCFWAQMALFSTPSYYTSFLFSCLILVEFLLPANFSYLIRGIAQLCILSDSFLLLHSPKVSKKEIDFP